MLADTLAVHDFTEAALKLSLISSISSKMWLTPELKEHLIYWKNPRDSGIIFGFVLVFLLGIRYVSIISVLANMALALITSTMAFRIYKSVLSAVNKTQDGHPFKVVCHVNLVCLINVLGGHISIQPTCFPH